LSYAWAGLSVPIEQLERLGALKNELVDFRRGQPGRRGLALTTIYFCLLRVRAGGRRARRQGQHRPAGLSFFDDKMEGLMANTAKPVGRGGMSVDANGTERPLAYWPDTLADASPVSWGKHGRFTATQWRLLRSDMSKIGWSLCFRNLAMAWRS